jgi:hypothetical protein
MIPYLNWIPSGLLLGLFTILSIQNWLVFWRRHVRAEHAPSWTPLLAGLCGAVGFWIVPVAPLHGYWWLPFFIDWGSIPGLGYTAAWHINRSRRERI